MSDLANVELLTGVELVNDPRHLDIHKQLRRKLEEGNGFEYWEDVVVITPAIANTEFLVQSLNLKRTPNFYLIIKKNKAVDVYSGDTISTTNKIYLKATVALATITVRVFV